MAMTGSRRSASLRNAVMDGGARQECRARVRFQHCRQTGFDEPEKPASWHVLPCADGSGNVGSLALARA
jgi:hypothetical protein